MFSRVYQRALGSSGLWDIDNPERTDNGAQVYLAAEIATAVPGWQFKLCCSGDVAEIKSSEDPPVDVSVLDSLVESHRMNA